MKRQDYIKIASDIRGIRIQCRKMGLTDPQKQAIETEVNQLVETVSKMFERDCDQFPETFKQACEVLMIVF